jgi:uncharacterized linocin/CFP29 family protein
LICKDFRLYWRDIEAAKKYGMPLELGPAAAAAAFCALKEDELIFRGDDECGYKGLMNAKGRTTVKVQGWGEVEEMFQNVVSATENLMSAGFYGPYAMAVSPSIYAMMHRVYSGGSGVLVVNMIRELITDGIFQSPVLKEEEAVVLATGRENLDLVIGQDLVTAYLGPDEMDHPFRVLETAVLRIKRPAAICDFSAQ